MQIKHCILGLLSFVAVGCVQDIEQTSGDVVQPQTRAAGSNGQVFYYYGYENRKIFLNKAQDKVFVKFAKNATKEQYRAVVKGNSSSLRPARSNSEEYFVEGASFNTAILEGVTFSSDELKSFKHKKEIASVTYLLEYNGSQSAYTDEFIVKLKDGTSYSELQELADENNCEIGKEDEFVPNQYNLYVSKTSELDAIQVANLFYETGLFEFAEPNLIDFNAENSSDRFFSYQWGLKNTGQSGGTAGVDINVEQAWTITKGNPSIRIAVIDSGIDLTHPDFKGNLLVGHDVTGYGTEGAPYSNRDSHGTSVAGVIGALQNNLVGGSYEGISGVAPNCKIVPVKASIDNNFQRVHSSAAINWVANNNKAEVINCSFGSQNPPTTNLTSAIANALAKGCVVVCSSGNDGLNNVGYPADSNPNIIAVGANERTGMRAYFSNYGTEIDIVAPGVDIYTTDRQGAAGYVSGNYIPDIDGTSFSAPHVAGVAALMLSVNPNLTVKQVVNIIESTARKVGGYSYTTTSGRLNGTWNNEMGYGLVDAYAAVAKAIVPPATPQVVAYSTDMYNLGDEETVVWHPGDGAGFNVTSDFDEVEWAVTPAEWTHNNGYSISLTPPQTHPNGPNATSREFIYAMCRIKKYGIWSGWSNAAIIYLDYSFPWEVAPQISAEDSLKINAFTSPNVLWLRKN